MVGGGGGGTAFKQNCTKNEWNFLMKARVCANYFLTACRFRNNWIKSCTRMKKKFSKPSVQSAGFSRFMIHPIPEHGNHLSRTLKIGSLPGFSSIRPLPLNEEWKITLGTRLLFQMKPFQEHFHGTIYLKCIQTSLLSDSEKVSVCGWNLVVWSSDWNRPSGTFTW